MGTYVLDDQVASPRRLATAGQTVHDVRLLLKHGRGNVKADDIPSHGHNGIGSSVAMGGMDGEIKVARAVVMGASVCNQTAPLAAIVHAPHMADGEISATYAAKVPVTKITDEGDAISIRAGHTWNELQRGDRDETSTVVMDAWANGPAVRLKDSTWGREPAREGTWSMDKNYAEFLKERVEALVPLLRSDDSIRREVRLKQDAPTSWNKYAEPQVISPEFAESVRKALVPCPEDEKKEIASRMIRDAYGMEPHWTNHQSAVISVLEAVGRLDSLPRPPVVPSEYSTAIGSSRPGAEQKGAGNARTDLASSSRSRERSSRGR
ncbi:type III secretion protein [Rhizobium bangladeshense]|uniref:type III secretion protein n=1 Tax=Rhizobium bangladeshense TaxID=1138189 RepID=UPI002180AD55|nr:type III secretion protein [Rhizobium bangladeshense]